MIIKLIFTGFIIWSALKQFGIIQKYSDNYHDRNVTIIDHKKKGG
tara:strand:+ start:13524 stop:13658 length:135 start_codon:yes stop_codon:yes gene_type:complete